MVVQGEDARTGGRKLPDKLTPISTEEMLRAVYSVWLYRLRGSPPSIVALEIIVAQWALETGWGRFCHCFNIGNAKAKPNGPRDWTFFKCCEELPASTARSEAQRDQRVVIRREYVLGGRAMASVLVFPEHPWCCFHAFESFEAGVTDHLELLHRRFPEAFAAAHDGDSTAFARELKRRWYYTASVESYTKTLVGCVPRVRKAAEAIDWAQLPLLTEAQKARVDGVTALSAQLTDDDWHDMRAERDAEVAW